MESYKSCGAIIPTMEAPGHGLALNRNYPEVFSNKIGEQPAVSFTTENGEVVVAESLLCAGSKTAMEGVRTLIHEICQLFPDSPYIHIGGDEANIKVWEYCEECVRYMKEHDISDVYELYSDYVGRVAKMVLEEGRTPIVWEGFPKKGAERIPRETIVIGWESHYHMAYDLVAEGFRIINASWQPLYIVNNTRWDVKDIMAWNVYNWQHWWEESEAALNPITLAPTEQVLGAQLCAWEGTYERDINFIMENAAALCERNWNVRRLWSDADFVKRHERVTRLVAKLIQAR